MEIIPLKVFLKYDPPTLFVKYRTESSSKLRIRRIPVRQLKGSLEPNVTPYAILETLLAKHDILEWIAQSQLLRMVTKLFNHVMYDTDSPSKIGKRPALIKPLGKETKRKRVRQGDMEFDPVAMKWVSLNEDKEEDFMSGFGEIEDFSEDTTGDEAGIGGGLVLTGGTRNRSTSSNASGSSSISLEEKNRGVATRDAMSISRVQKNSFFISETNHEQQLSGWIHEFGNAGEDDPFAGDDILR